MRSNYIYFLLYVSVILLEAKYTYLLRVEILNSYYTLDVRS